MPDDDFLPGDDTTLRTNAWCGEAALSPRGAEFDQWGMKGKKKIEGKATKQPLGPEEIDPAKWSHWEVGWGIVLPDRDIPAKEKAIAADAPECIRKLLAERGGAIAADAPECIRKLLAERGGAPVFRYRSDLDEGLLRRYAADGTPSDPGVGVGRPRGVAHVPWYLLIVGSPEEIPWEFQYELQQYAYVGRLDLDAAGLERYVEALLTNWAGSAVDRTKPVVWAVDYGWPDISRLMRRTIADRLAKVFIDDREGEFDMAAGVLSDAKATHASLIAALAERRPGFVATTSHGATFPLDDTEAMRAQLGLPVDNTRSAMNLKLLTAAWSPYGAIWYAHACCSAGCEATSSFAGSASPDSSLGRTLAALGKLGARSAPLPRELLGGAKPARAFIGHIEPTFDWTLRDTLTGQTTTTHIVQTLYNRLHLASRPPIGFAMKTYHEGIGGLWRACNKWREKVDNHVAGAAERVRRAKLIASDLEAMVLLGDPTVGMVR